MFYVYMGYFMKVLVFIMVFASIAFLAYVSTKLLGKKISGGMKGKVMNVVESMSLGVDRQLYLVKVGSQYFLISASGKNVVLLSAVELREEDLGNGLEEDAGNDFSALFNKYKGVIFKKPGHSEEEPMPDTEKELLSRSNRIKNLYRDVDGSKTNDKDDRSNG